MKKLVFILGLILSLNSGVGAKETDKQEFVNPIFNQPLIPMSLHSGYVYLTPTSIKFMTPLDKNLLNAAGQCELIKNQETFIELSCKVK